MIASCTAGRTCFIACELLSGQVRLVSSTIASCRFGSIHSDVPVYPKCPNESGEKYSPDWDGIDGVSQPRVRVVPAGDDCRVVNSSTVSGLRIGAPPRNMH